MLQLTGPFWEHTRANYNVSFVRVMGPMSIEIQKPLSNYLVRDLHECVPNPWQRQQLIQD